VATIVSSATAAPAARSWWLAEAAPAADPGPLEGDRAADVCIVGGGFTGLRTALLDRSLARLAPAGLVPRD